MTRRIDTVSRAIVEIGRVAGVVVGDETGKTASAHDLRRSFGDRWSRRVMPAELKSLMRHESIETKIRYYATSDAEKMGPGLWAAAEMDQPFQHSFQQPPEKGQAVKERQAADV